MRRLTVDEWFDSRKDAEAAEVAAIKAEKPKYNKTHGTNPPRRRRKPTGYVASATPTPARPAPGAWIDGGDSIGWTAPLPPEPLEPPEQVAALRAACRNGCDSLGYA